MKQQPSFENRASYFAGPIICIAASGMHPGARGGAEIYQAYIGSSANPGFRDFAVAALIVKGREVHDRVSFDINPSSRQQRGP
jgi:homoaconitase/3-isopropylmalate dehydratase large subunit